MNYEILHDRRQIVWMAVAIFVAIVAAVTLSTVIVTSLLGRNVSAATNQSNQATPAVTYITPANTSATTNSCSEQKGATQSNSSDGSGAMSGSMFWAQPASSPTYNQSNVNGSYNTYNKDSYNTKNKDSYNTNGSYNTKSIDKSKDITKDSYNQDNDTNNSQIKGAILPIVYQL